MTTMTIQELEEHLDSQEKAREEEAHFFWVLSDFQELVRINGVEKVMKELDENTFWAIEKYLGR